MKSLILVIAGLLVSPLVLAKEMRYIPAVGAHHPLFTFEKNENPQNIMVVFTRVDKTCRILRENGKPVLGFYWLMDRSRYKPVHALIIGGIRKRLVVEPEVSGRADARSFVISLNDLKELKHDLQSPRLKVVAKANGKGCEVEAIVNLGPAVQEQKLRLKTIFSHAKKILLPPFRKVQSVTFEGVSLATGETTKQTYLSKR